MPHRYDTAYGSRLRASLGRDDDGWETGMTQPLLIEHDDGVDRVTLNPPGQPQCGSIPR